MIFKYIIFEKSIALLSSVHINMADIPSNILVIVIIFGTIVIIIVPCALIFSISQLLLQLTKCKIRNIRIRKTQTIAIIVQPDDSIMIAVPVNNN